MIVDRIENAHLYTSLDGGIAKALDLLKAPGLVEKADGKYDVEDEKLFYVVDRYQTQPVEQGRFEAHRKYIDVQFIAAGQEMIGYCHLENLQIDEPYDAGNDIAFYKQPAEITAVNLTAGMFCILFPEDAHMPCRQTKGPENVTKIVVKVRTDAEE